MIPMSDQIYYERDLSGRPTVFLASTGETWETWSAAAAEIREKCGEIPNALIGPVYYQTPPLKPEPAYLGQQLFSNVWRPVINVCIRDETSWSKAVQAAQDACLEAEKEYSRTQQLDGLDLFGLCGPDSGKTVNRDAMRPQKETPVTALIHRLNGDQKTERNTGATRLRPPYEPTYKKRLTASRPAGKRKISTRQD